MYVLILLISVGAIHTTSLSITTEVFSSQKSCEYAGNEAKKLYGSMIKSVNFFCVPQ